MFAGDVISLLCMRKAERGGGKLGRTERSARMDVTRQHLDHGLLVERKPGDAVLRSEEKNHDGCHQVCEDESPPGESGSHGIQRCQTDHKTKQQHQTEPPVGHLIVVFGYHKLVMGVHLVICKNVKLVLLLRLPSLPEDVGGRDHQFLEIGNGEERPTSFDIIVVPQEQVNKGGRDAHVGGDEVADVGTREVWNPVFGNSRRVDRVVSIKD